MRKTERSALLWKRFIYFLVCIWEYLFTHFSKGKQHTLNCTLNCVVLERVVDYGICKKKIMKLDNSSISTGDVQCLWWCEFNKLARNILTNCWSEKSNKKRYLYEIETIYFSFPMIESKTIKSVKTFNSKTPLYNVHAK